MNGRANWAYVRARLQARQGDRLRQEEWRALEASPSLTQFIDRAQRSSLRAFLERIEPQMTSHDMERLLRNSWRAYVADVARWVPPSWKEAVRWTARLPDQPIADALLRGELLPWAAQDANLADPPAEPATVDAGARPAAVSQDTAAGTVITRWNAAWRALWPRHSAIDGLLLDRLTKAVAAHMERLGQVPADDTSGRYRLELASPVTRMFRRHGDSPAAVFCHLILMALDLERLRGGLVRRRLFETP